MIDSGALKLFGRWSLVPVKSTTALRDGLAAHVAGPGAGGHSPSDLELVTLSQDEIDEFEDEWRDL